MGLAKGTRLGPYEIVECIGAGGMGQAYKARDTRLERIVAIKVSSSAFNDRFQREAQAIASLNHPHICTTARCRPRVPRHGVHRRDRD